MEIETFLPPAVVAGERALTSDEWGELLDAHLELRELEKFDRLARLAPDETARQQLSAIREILEKQKDR